MPCGLECDGACESDLLYELVRAGQYGSAEEREESLAVRDSERGGWPPVTRTPCFLVALERRIAGHVWVSGDGQQLRFTGRYAFEGTGKGVFDRQGRLSERKRDGGSDSSSGGRRGGAAAGAGVGVGLRGATAGTDSMPVRAAAHGCSKGIIALSARRAPSLSVSPALHRWQTVVHRLMAVARERRRGRGRNECVLPIVPFTRPHKSSDLLRDVRMERQWCLNEVRENGLMGR